MTRSDRQHRGRRLGTRLLQPAASLESHDLITTAVRRGADPELSLIAEPLELLCRDLERSAALTAPARRATRRSILDLLGRPIPPSSRSEPPDPTESPARNEASAPTVVVTGPPGPRLDHVASVARRSRRWASPPLSDDDVLETLFRAMAFETRWHVPSWAEWFVESDHAGAFRRLGGQRRGQPGAPPWLLAHWQHRDVLEAVLDATRPALIVVVEPTADDLPRFVDSVVTERSRWSDDVDIDKVQRYWSWRFARAARSAAMVRDRDPDRVVMIEAEHHLDEAGARVRRGIEDAVGDR